MGDIKTMLDIGDPLGMALGAHDAVFGDGKSSGPGIPADRKMVNEGLSTLGAYRELAGPTLSFMNDFGPAYQDAANNSLRAQLVGSDGKSGSLGLYSSLIAPAISQTQAAGNTAQRSADVADVEQLGQRATAAIRAANPQQASLLNAMNKQAMEGLAAGTGMTPDMQRQTQQGIRAAQGARGLGLGNIDAFQEALTMGTRGQQLLQQRQGYAQAVAGVNQQAVGDPFMAVVGRPSMTSPYAQQMLNSSQQAAQANAPQTNPYTTYASDLYNTNYNAAYANLFNQRNNDTAQMAAIMGMIGNVAGGGAAALCWVARAVYGISDPRWMEFREWLLSKASAKFRAWYLANGERYAVKVKASAKLRLTWFRFMEAKRKELGYV